MKYAPAFEKLVNDAKAKVREVSIDDVKKRLDAKEDFLLVDIREESEWAKGHLPAATYIGRGILERDIEGKVPSFDADIVLYCGGGGRSALSAESLQKMGYTRVSSMAGGFRGWTERGFPTEGV
jgi:rhodanese-related sulfurtransferase